MVRVTRLELRDFRNYERAEVALGPGLTVICGPNGAGKTNLLEALYFGCTGRSCRTSNERELVRFGQKVTRVSVGVEAEDGPHQLDVGFEPGEQKRFRIDSAQVERPPAGEVRPLVGVFMPDRLDLVKGAPSLRRAHIDQVIAALWPARSTARSEYSRALAQRNALVARIRAGAARPELLDPWDSELARHGIAVMEARSEALRELEDPFARLAAELGLPGRCALEYRPRSKAGDAEGLRAELAERREDDLARGFTGHGPHRDDIALIRDRRALRSYGSQGQQRVGLLALLFAESEALAAVGKAPLMLLDDVMSELDASRRERLVELVRAHGQAVVSATEAEHVPGARESEDVELLFVADGAVALEAAL
jgi:DNA replication and repair protein RecF